MKDRRSCSLESIIIDMLCPKYTHTACIHARDTFQKSWDWDMIPILPHSVPGIAQQCCTHFQWVLAMDCWQSCLMRIQNVTSLFCKNEQDFSQ